MVFDAPGDGDFEELAVDLFPERGFFAVSFELINIGGELLGNGGATLALAIHVLHSGAGDADDVEGTVFVESFVFAGDDGFAEVGGDLIEGDDIANFAVEAGEFRACFIENHRAFRHFMELG